VIFVIFRIANNVHLVFFVIFRIANNVHLVIFVIFRIANNVHLVFFVYYVYTVVLYILSKISGPTTSIVVSNSVFISIIYTMDLTN
jgi:hypothetical protein